MAGAALKEITVDRGIVITKYGHAKGPLANCEIFEAGHPVLDENSLKAAGFAVISYVFPHNTTFILIWVGQRVGAA